MGTWWIIGDCSFGRTKDVFSEYIKKKNYYYAEKKFLWFFIRRYRDKDYSSREEAIEYIRNFLKEIEQEQDNKKEILDFSNQISDPTKLIESKQLETKRIEYK